MRKTYSFEKGMCQENFAFWTIIIMACYLELLGYQTSQYFEYIFNKTYILI